MFLILAWRDVIVRYKQTSPGPTKQCLRRNNLEWPVPAVFRIAGPRSDLGPAAGGVWHGADRGSGVKCRCGVVNCPLSVQAGIRPVRDCEFHPEHGQFAGRFGDRELACVPLAGGCGRSGTLWTVADTTISLRRMFAAVSLLVTLPIAAWMLWHNGADLLLTFGPFWEPSF